MGELYLVGLAILIMLAAMATLPSARRDHIIRSWIQ